MTSSPSRKHFSASPDARGSCIRSSLFITSHSYNPLAGKTTLHFTEVLKNHSNLWHLYQWKENTQARRSCRSAGSHYSNRQRTACGCQAACSYWHGHLEKPQRYRGRKQLPKQKGTKGAPKIPQKHLFRNAKLQEEKTFWRGKNNTNSSSGFCWLSSGINVKQWWKSPIT